MCLLFRKQSVWRWCCVSPNQHYPHETQAVRPTWSRKKLFIGKKKRKNRFRKKKWEKSWPPVNTPQFQLIFIQMLTPVNRWHNVLLHFLFLHCILKMLTLYSMNHLRKRLLLHLWESTHCLLLILTAFRFDFAYTVCSILLSWNVFQHVEHQGTTINLSWESADRFKWGNLKEDMMFSEHRLVLWN